MSGDVGTKKARLSRGMVDPVPACRLTERQILLVKAEVRGGFFCASGKRSD